MRVLRHFIHNMYDNKRIYKMKFEELFLGQEYVKEFCVSEEKGEKFADVSEDYNLLHLDEKYAQKTMFKGRIVHGMLVASFISGVLGNDFPGSGTVYLEQNLKFIHPVRYGDRISVIIKIEELVEEKYKVKIKTTCINQMDDIVIDGYAWVMKKC